MASDWLEDMSTPSFSSAPDTINYETKSTCNRNSPSKPKLINNLNKHQDKYYQNYLSNYKIASKKGGYYEETLAAKGTIRQRTDDRPPVEDINEEILNRFKEDFNLQKEIENQVGLTIELQQDGTSNKLQKCQNNSSLFGKFDFEKDTFTESACSQDSDSNSDSDSNIERSDSNSSSEISNPEALKSTQKLTRKLLTRNFNFPKIYKLKLSSDIETDDEIKIIKRLKRLNRKFWYYNEDNKALYYYKLMIDFFEKFIAKFEMDGEDVWLHSWTGRDFNSFSTCRFQLESNSKVSITKIFSERDLENLQFKSYKDFFIRSNLRLILHMEDSQNGKINFYNRNYFYKLVEIKKNELFKTFEMKKEPRMTLDEFLKLAPNKNISGSLPIFLTKEYYIQQPNTINLPDKSGPTEIAAFEKHWGEWLVSNFDGKFVLFIDPGKKAEIFYQPKLITYLQSCTDSYFKKVYKPFMHKYVKSLPEVFKIHKNFEYSISFDKSPKDRRKNMVELKHELHYKLEAFCNLFQAEDLELIKRDFLCNIQPDQLVIAFSNKDQLFGRAVVVKNILEYNKDLAEKDKQTSKSSRSSRSNRQQKVKINFIDYNYLEYVTTDNIYLLKTFDCDNYPRNKLIYMGSTEINTINRLLTGPALYIEVKVFDQTTCRQKERFEHLKKAWTEHLREILVYESKTNMQQLNSKQRESHLYLYGQQVQNPNFFIKVKLELANRATNVVNLIYEMSQSEGRNVEGVMNRDVEELLQIKNEKDVRGRSREDTGYESKKRSYEL